MNKLKADIMLQQQGSYYQEEDIDDVENKDIDIKPKRKKKRSKKVSFNDECGDGANIGTKEECGDTDISSVQETSKPRRKKKPKKDITIDTEIDDVEESAVQATNRMSMNVGSNNITFAGKDNECGPIKYHLSDGDDAMASQDVDTDIDTTTEGFGSGLKETVKQPFKQGKKILKRQMDYVGDAIDVFKDDLKDIKDDGIKGVLNLPVRHYKRAVDTVQKHDIKRAHDIMDNMQEWEDAFTSDGKVDKAGKKVKRDLKKATRKASDKIEDMTEAAEVGVEDQTSEFDTECGDGCNTTGFKKECGDSKVGFDQESAKPRKKKKKIPKITEDDIDFEDEASVEATNRMSASAGSSNITTTGSGNKIESIDYTNEDVDPTTETTEGDAYKPGYHDEYAVYLINQIDEERLHSERQALTSMIESIYKEYAMSGFEMSEDAFMEMDSDENETEDEYYQERFFGGTGKQVEGLAKPFVKGAKKLNDMRHGVGKPGIIRNVIHRTSKDLKKGGILYKLLTWPFLVVKNLVQTIYHKAKSFIQYKGLLLGIEVKVNREISKIKKRGRDLPKMAVAGGIGYVATAAASIAKGEGLPLNPIDFITSEGAKMINELGRDTMIRALTSKLADAIEDSPEAIRAVLAKKNAVKGKLTPEAGKNSPPIITMNNSKITVENLINMKGVEQLLNDIDNWADLAETTVVNAKAGDEATIRSCLTKAKDLESRYLKDGKLDLSAIFNKKSGAVKISEFYDELSSKLTEKAHVLEKGLNKLTELEGSIKEGNISITEDTQKTLSEINVALQHACNAFVEAIESIEDLGKYVMSTMETYLDCLKETSSSMVKGKNSKAPTTATEDEE